ncbi:MAG: thioredoxin domain-containing protein [Leptolyngbyaceae cyanobacterium bins.349]|nr:thioredoxin domain-containing protein [Leptolyngbyaceae cyanobacterium bins.349]
MLTDTQYIVLTENNFHTEVLKAKTLVLVDCWASWCSSFYQINPVYRQLQNSFPEAIKIGRLNIATAEKLAALYGIRVVPTLLLFHNGQLVERVIGCLSQPDLTRKLNSLLSAPMISRSHAASL